MGSLVGSGTIWGLTSITPNFLSQVTQFPGLSPNEHALFRSPNESFVQGSWPLTSSMGDPPLNPLLFDNGDEQDDASDFLHPLLPPHINYKKVNKYTNDTSEFFKTFYFHASFGNIMLLIGLVTFTLWVIVMNLLTVIGLLRTHRTGHMADLYLANLAVGDFLLGFLILPLMSVVILLGYFPFAKLVCNVWVFLDYYLIVAASFGSCAMMCNYLWMMQWPHTYPTDAKSHILAIAFCWIAVNLSWTPSFFNDRFSTLYPFGQCGFSISRNQYFSFYIGISGFYLPLAISLICGIWSLAGLKKQSGIPLLSWRQSFFIGRRRRSGRLVNEVIWTFFKILPGTIINSLEIDVENQKSKFNMLDENPSKSKESRVKTPKFFGPGAAAEGEKVIGNTGDKINPKTKKRPELKLQKQGSITNSATDPKVISQMAKDHYPLVVSSLVLFIICRSLFYVYFGVGSFVPNFLPLDLSNGVYWLMHSNAAISPLIHFAFDPELREEVCRMLKFRISPQRTPIVQPKKVTLSPLHVPPSSIQMSCRKDSTTSNLSHFSTLEQPVQPKEQLVSIGSKLTTPIQTENEISGRLTNVDINKKPQIRVLDVNKLPMENGIE